jgi:hypothetical protein
MRRPIRLAAAAALSAFALGANARGQDLPYAYDLATWSPSAFAALQQTLPDRLRSEDWVYRLRGTATPMERIEVGGEAYVGGWVCKPHDCGANQFAFIVARDGSRAFALLRIDGEGDQLFGNPDAAVFGALQGLAD